MMTIVDEKMDCKLIRYDRIFDNRGWFQIAFNAMELKNIGIEFQSVQQLNHSLTLLSGTIRGLNYQEKPYEQAKIIRCVKGSLYSVAVDIRRNSSTFGKWCAFALSPDNTFMFIPRGYAHGFIVNEDNTELEYMTDNVYSKEHAKSIRYDDSDLGIDWTQGGIVSILEDTLSDKNRYAQRLEELADEGEKE